jgi:hypothetical protein
MLWQKLNMDGKLEIIIIKTISIEALLIGDVLLFDWLQCQLPSVNNSQDEQICRDDVVMSLQVVSKTSSAAPL